MTPEQFAEALEILHEQGRTIPVMKFSFIGREYGGAFDWNAFFVLEALNACFEAYDVTDDPDPEFGTKVAELQRRHFETDPELVRHRSPCRSALGG